MALSEDQRAMLQLLLEGSQSYEDIASLLGGDEEEVRSRARDALTEIGGEDPDHEVALTDYLLGQADPIGRADVVRHLKEDAEDHALAESLVAKLRLIAPDAELPRLPASAKGGRRAPRREPREPRERDGDPSPPRKPRERRPRSGGRSLSLPSISLPRIPTRPRGGEPLSPNRSRLLAALGAGAVILIAVVLAVAGVFSGEEAETPDSATAAAGSETEVPIRLEPQGNTRARGDAIFGVLPEGAFYLDLRVRNLPQLPEGKAYVMWFLASDEAGYPVPVPLQPDESGSFNDRLSLPAETLSVAEQSQFFDIAVNDLRELDRNIQRSLQQDGALLAFPGGSVLRGELTRSPTGAATDLGAGAEDLGGTAGAGGAAGSGE